MVKKLQALKAKKGFTLVELIVVIAIIGVLAAILIPTLSGVIESSRKRSAESTCQSIQSMAKTFASTVMSKKGETCTSSSTVDMDEDGVTAGNMKQYIERQIPDLVASNGKTHAAKITLANGNVSEVIYTEGSFTAKWSASSGTVEAEKNATGALSGVGVTVA